MKATIIIPIFNLQNERKRNFQRILEYIYQTNIPTIIIEQRSNNLCDIVDVSRPNITYMNIDIGDTIHKSFLINFASSFVKTKYLWMLDADVFLKYQNIVDMLDDQDVIKPFETIVRLTKEDTDYFIENRKIAFKVGALLETNKSFGPMSFIIKKSIFDLEKMNEKFVGFGWEDIEFAERIRDKYELTVFDTKGLHLYHPHNRVNETKNKDLFTKIRGYDPEPDNSIPYYLKEKTMYISTEEKSIQEKLDLSQLSIVIPVKIDTEDRLNNFIFSTKYLYDNFVNFELIVIEQDLHPKLEKICQDYGCVYINRKVAGTFYKTYNVNLAVSVCNNPYAMTYDCDVFFKPLALQQALQRLTSHQTDFIYPYNRFMIEIDKNTTIDMTNLPYISQHDDKLPSGTKLLYGHADYECTGGGFMYNKKEFLLVGGYNENIISYGCEDNEIEVRLKMLDHKVERLYNYNCYHIEHSRSLDSNYNNFSQSNIAEFSRIKQMTVDDLKTYVASGMKKIHFDATQHLSVIHTPNEYSLRVSTNEDKLINNDVKCSIIFTNYGSHTQLTEEYLDRFKSWKTKDYEIIAVIHNETVLHRVFLEYCHKIGLIDKLIYCVEGHGHLRGIALGVQHASSEFIMVINNDVRISKEIIDYCADRLHSETNLGIIGWHYDFDPNFEGTFWVDGKLKYESRLDQPSKIDKLNLMKMKTSRWFTGKVFSDIGENRILACNGSFMCTKKSLWTKIGGMDPHLYHHEFADDYYTYGVLDLGYNVENIPKYIRMGNHKEVFDCQTDRQWRGVHIAEGVDKVSFGELTKEQYVSQLIIKLYDNPNVLMIGEGHPAFEGIEYKKRLLNTEKVDVLLLSENVSDLNAAKCYLTKNGCIVSSAHIFDTSFTPCGSLFVYFNVDIKREAYE